MAKLRFQAKYGQREKHTAMCSTASVALGTPSLVRRVLEPRNELPISGGLWPSNFILLLWGSGSGQLSAFAVDPYEILEVGGDSLLFGSLPHLT